MLFEVPQNELIKKTAEELKKLIDMPSWGLFVKTGAHKERPPVERDWWYIRAAAVLRKVYLLGPIGVSKLRTKYGGKKNRGVRPEKFYKGSGAILRKVLQQLEEAQLVKQAVIKKHKGRVITPKGISVLFSAAKSIRGTVAKKAPKPEVRTPNPKKEEKKEHPLGTKNLADYKEKAPEETKKETVSEEKKPEETTETKVSDKPKEEVKEEAKHEDKKDKAEAISETKVSELSETKSSEHDQKSEKQSFSGAQNSQNFEQPKVSDKPKKEEKKPETRPKEKPKVSDKPKAPKKEETTTESKKDSEPQAKPEKPKK
ncbi:30S ribosomal protein S19e [Candidatus Woesearchaeota archaeon]|nr:30S ribosomal protein S19e [Candidatus Woesearchaeota archaeon]